MLRMVRTLSLVALVLAAVPLVMPGAAFAQYREFSGKIDKINKKKVIVNNRQGDKVSFNKVDDTAVEDSREEDKKKETWKDLKKGDWVTVSWKFVDKPRKAYKVKVLPDREEAGEDQ